MMSLNIDLLPHSLILKNSQQGIAFDRQNYHGQLLHVSQA